MPRHITAEAISAAVTSAIEPPLQSQHQGTSDRQQLSEVVMEICVVLCSDGFVMSLFILVLFFF